MFDSWSDRERVRRRQRSARTYRYLQMESRSGKKSIKGSILILMEQVAPGSLIDGRVVLSVGDQRGRWSHARLSESSMGVMCSRLISSLFINNATWPHNCLLETWNYWARRTSTRQVDLTLLSLLCCVLSNINITVRPGGLCHCFLPSFLFCLHCFCVGPALIGRQT